MDLKEAVGALWSFVRTAWDKLAYVLGVLMMLGTDEDVRKLGTIIVTLESVQRGLEELEREIEVLEEELRRREEMGKSVEKQTLFDYMQPGTPEADLAEILNLHREEMKENILELWKYAGADELYYMLRDYCGAVDDPEVKRMLSDYFSVKTVLSDWYPYTASEEKVDRYIHSLLETIDSAVGSANIDGACLEYLKAFKELVEEIDRMWHEHMNTLEELERAWGV